MGRRRADERGTGEDRERPRNLCRHPLMYTVHGNVGTGAVPTEIRETAGAFKNFRKDAEKGISSGSPQAASSTLRALVKSCYTHGNRGRVSTNGDARRPAGPHAPWSHDQPRRGKIFVFIPVGEVG